MTVSEWFGVLLVVLYVVLLPLLAIAAGVAAAHDDRIERARGTARLPTSGRRE